MKKQTLITLLSASILAASAVCMVPAQAAPVAGAPGAAGPGGRGGGGRGGFGGGRGGRGGAQTPPGPPAPVPPEVAIPRPTSDELAKMNADLKQFVSTSSDKALLQKYESLLTVQMPRDNACIRPAPSARGNRHNGLVQTANTGDFDIMFIGDSITDLLGADNDGNGNPGGKPQVQKYFGDAKVANFGVSGDTTQGVLWGFQNGEGQGHKPKAVMLMIGTNNTTSGNSPTGAEIAEGVGADVFELRKDFPDAKILLMAIFPRGTGPGDSNRKKVEEANAIIARLDDKQHVFYMSINDKFLDDKGGLIGFRTTDHLHPVSEGFDIWMSSVAPTLKSWVK
jgi:lysophospholipase L1-like esterase